jgi:2-polyprenyl-6-methoxyphenol hydroxylase-like FAD-dependent oxidoreductase
LLAQGKANISILKSYEDERRDPIWAMIKYAVALRNIAMPTSQLQAKIVKTVMDTLSLVPASRDYVLDTTLNKHFILKDK